MRIIPVTPFERRIRKLIDEERYLLLQEELIDDPERGNIIQGTGGVRKYRFAIDGRGKSSGIRVIYYYRTAGGVIYLLDVYAKNEKSNLSKAERNELKKLIRELSR